MGYVTKTITESVGDLFKTTSYMFESSEDFLRWEGSQVSDQEEKVGVKVGHRYRVIGNVMDHGFEIGEEVEASSFDEYFHIRASNGIEEYWMTDEELEEV